MRDAVLVLVREPGRFILRGERRKGPSLKLAALLFLATPAVASELPYSLGSEAQNETAEFLLQEAKKNRVTESVKFADGTEQTTAAFSTIASSSTRVFAITGTNTAFDLCRASVTITVSGTSPVFVWFSGNMGNSSTVHSIATFLQDDSFVSPITSTTGACRTYGAGATTLTQACGFFREVPAPSEGSHTYCIGFRADSASTWSVSGDVPAQFGAWQIQ